MIEKNNDLKELKVRAGFLVILISVISLCITMFSGGIWFLSTDDFDFYNPSPTISGIDMNAQAQSSDEKEIFKNHYYKALEVLANTVGYGTTWLDLCADSQTLIDEQIYMQVCSDIYSSVEDIEKYLSKYISSDLIKVYMTDYYRNYDNGLYVIPFTVSKDDSYFGLESFSVNTKSNNKIEYTVTSKYSDIDCNNNCKYTYKKQTFILEKQNNNWIVTRIELPY